jgi:hypothetical protein
MVFDASESDTRLTLSIDDSIEIDEFCLFVLRFIADITNKTVEKGPEDGLVDQFTHLVMSLESVDDEQTKYAQVGRWSQVLS